MFPLKAGKWDWIALGEPWRNLPPKVRTGSSAPATLTQVTIEQDGSPAATTITGGQSVKVRAQGFPGLSHVKALLYNDTHTAPSGASSQSLLGTVVTLNAAGVTGTVGNYEAVIPLTTLLDAGGQTAQAVRGAARHLKKNEVTVAYGRTSPGTLAYSPNPTAPTALSDDFAGGLSNEKWKIEGPVGTQPTASGGRVEFPLASATDAAVLRTTHLDYQAVSPGTFEVAGTVGTTANPGGAGHAEVSQFIVYANYGSTNLEGYSLVFQTDGTTVSMAAGVNTDLDGNPNGTVFTVLPVTFPGTSGLPFKIIVDQVALEARYYTWDGTQFVLRHTAGGLPNIPRNNMAILMNASRHTTAAAPYMTYWLDSVSTTIRRPPQSHLLSLSPLALDGVPYDSLALLGNNNPGTFVVRPDLEGQFDVVDQTPGGYVFISPSTDLNAALVTFTPNVGDPIRLTLYSFDDEASQRADLATPPTGFSSVSVDRWVDKVFVAGATSTADFTWNSSDFSGGDSSDPPAPVGIAPELAFNAGQYQLRASGFGWNGRLYNGVGGGYAAGTEAIFVQSLSPLTAPAITTAFATVGGLTGNELVNGALLSMGPNGGNGYALVFTPLDQATIATILPAGGAVEKFFSGIFSPNGPGQHYTYNPPQAGDLIARFFDSPTEILTSLSALTVPPPDTTLPTVAFTAPTAGQAFGSTAIQVTGTLADNVGIDQTQVVLRLDGNDITPQAVVSATAITATLNGLTEGNHTLTLEAKDSSGNSAVMATVSFAVDLTGPVVTVVQPANGSTVSSSPVLVSGAAGDAVTVTVNGQAATLNGGNYSLVLALTEGANTVTVVGTDGVGNTSQQQVTVTRDSTPPPLVVSSPQDGSVLQVGAVVQVTGTTEAGVVVSLNGEVIALNGTNFSTPYTIQLGANLLTVRVVDSLGMEAQQTVTVTGTQDEVADVQAPTVTITNPFQGSFQGAAVTVQATFADNVGVVVGGVRVLLDGTDISAMAQLTAGGGTLALSQLTAGSHTVRFEASDAAGNLGTAQVQFVVDLSAPLITLTSPAENPLTTPDATVTIAGQVSDEQGVAALTLNGAALQLMVGSAFTATVPLAEGLNSFTLQATDGGGLTSTLLLTVTRFVPDTTPPLLVITRPGTQSAYTNQSPIFIEGQTEPGAALTADDSPVPVGPDGQFTHPLSLTEGVNSVLFLATDAAGNEAEAMREIVLDMVPPEVEWINPLPTGGMNFSEKIKFRVREIPGPAGSGVVLSQVELRVNTGAVPLVTAGPGEFEGPHLQQAQEVVLRVVAPDVAGNVGQSVMQPQGERTVTASAGGMSLQLENLSREGEGFLPGDRLGLKVLNGPQEVGRLTAGFRALGLSASLVLGEPVELMAKGSGVFEGEVEFLPDWLMVGEEMLEKLSFALVETIGEEGGPSSNELILLPEEGGNEEEITVEGTGAAGAQKATIGEEVLVRGNLPGVSASRVLALLRAEGGLENSPFVGAPQALWLSRDTEGAFLGRVVLEPGVLPEALSEGALVLRALLPLGQLSGEGLKSPEKLAEPTMVKESFFWRFKGAPWRLGNEVFGGNGAVYWFQVDRYGSGEFLPVPVEGAELRGVYDQGIHLALVRVGQLRFAVYGTGGRQALGLDVQKIGGVIIGFYEKVMVPAVGGLFFELREPTPDALALVEGEKLVSPPIELGLPEISLSLVLLSPAPGSIVRGNHVPLRYVWQADPGTLASIALKQGQANISPTVQTQGGVKGAVVQSFDSWGMELEPELFLKAIGRASESVQAVRELAKKQLKIFVDNQPPIFVGLKEDL